MEGRDALIAAARKLWGNETETSKHEMRFGRHGSKAIRLDQLTWYDHESQQGGGVNALCIQAGIPGVMGSLDGLSTGEIAYDYYDEQHRLLFQVVRKPGHKFIQRRPEGSNGWAYNLKGVRRVLYRLPQLAAADPLATVFVCEGEKDADNLGRLGFVTTTNPGGAGKWRDDYSAFLKGHPVVILPDNDVAGIEHAAKVFRSLNGVCNRRIVKLPGLPAKGDVSDWIRAGGSRDEMLELVEQTKNRAADFESSAWDGELLMPDSKPRPLPILTNAVLMIKNLETLKGRFAYDEMLRAPVIAKSPPEPLTDVDVTEVQCVLQRAGLRRIGRETTRDAIAQVATAQSFHPVRDWLQGLVWDGTPRLGNFAATYLGCEDTAYTRAIGSMFLVSMVARILRPGCKADHMVILEGPQGILKSTACAVLAGKYFSDSLPELSAGKDVSVHLRGKWLIEVSELHAFSRVEANHLKGFLSRDHERFRPPYGHEERIEPRQCVFIGTSNKDAYLKDETGGRRFWPLKCGMIDIEALRRDKNQLFAEAVAEFNNGVPWWPDAAFEQQYIQREQEARYEHDPWYETFLEALRQHYKTAWTTKELAALVEVKVDRLGMLEQKRIAAIMRKLGWKSKHTENGNRWVQEPG